MVKKTGAGAHPLPALASSACLTTRQERLSNKEVGLASPDKSDAPDHSM